MTLKHKIKHRCNQTQKQSRSLPRTLAVAGEETAVAGEETIAGKRRGRRERERARASERESDAANYNVFNF